jgi:hypothetical protein
MKSSRSEDHHTPHWGSLSHPGEIVILLTWEVFPHRGRSLYSLSTGGDHHTPHRGSLSPPGESFPTGGDHRNPPRGVFTPTGETIILPQGESKKQEQTRTNKNKLEQTRTNKNNKNKQEQKEGETIILPQGESRSLLKEDITTLP